VLRCERHEAHRARSCAVELLQRIRARAEQHFIDAHALHATEAEIAAVRAYEHAFAQHDRAQRARKLEEIETRLVHVGAEMDAAEYERLIEFRAVLRRLEAYEADVARGSEVDAEVPTAVVTRWIEQAKLDPVLYRRYGGAVGLKPAGAYAHFARAALAAEYMQREGLAVADAEVERHLLALLWAPPALAYRGDAPDFTPFWLRPLVPSYVAR
jgi:hypothetical protein